MKKLVILDGNSLAHRAYHALPLLTTTKGLFTNAVYGFTNMLQKIVHQENPDYLAVAFDSSRLTFRHQEYKEYKAHRSATPAELRPQFPLIKDVLNALKIPVLEIEGYEADDILGTVARAAEEQGLETLIVTGDTDMLQLVTEHVQALITRKGISELERFNIEAVNKKYGLDPCQLIDYKGLVGDPSDNIPGVSGIGQKTATTLLKQFRSIECCLANLDKLSKKVRNLLMSHKDIAFLSKRLATIDKQVPIVIDFSLFKVEEPDYEKLMELFQELEFRKLLKDIQDELPESDRNLDEIKIRSIYAGDHEAVENLLAEIKKYGKCAFYLDQNCSYLGLAWSDKDAVVLKFSKDSQEKALILKKFFCDPSLEKWSHDDKKAMVILGRQGIRAEGIKGDTMLAVYLLNPASSSPTLEESFLKHKNSAMVFSQDDIIAAGQHAIAIFSLWPVLLKEMEEADLLHLYQEIELPLSSVLAEMELTGIKVDVEQLDKMSSEFGELLAELAESIYFLAGEDFNINSPKQLGVILFERLKLPIIKKTKTGYSTNAAVLEALVPYHDIAAKILEYRQLMKLKTTYTDGLKNLINLKTGKLYSTFNQTVTATGRLSSTEPNLQNIPIRVEIGRKIRRAFMPSAPGWLLLSADYSQIELRILAHLSQDIGLLDAFAKGEDVHTRTASSVFGVPPEEVTPDLRRRAKGVNFGIVYGITDFGLARDLGVNREEAGTYIASYFHKYPGVKRFIDDSIARARETGYVTTLFKRRRYLPDLFSSNRAIRSFGERTAVNTPIQGTAADIIKLAMIKVNKNLKEQGLQAKMLLQVHDELVFEAPPEEIENLTALVREGMEKIIEISVPLDVDVKIGCNWYDMNKVDV